MKMALLRDCNEQALGMSQERDRQADIEKEWKIFLLWKM